jgi:hypothetical protein
MPEGRRLWGPMAPATEATLHDISLPDSEAAPNNCGKLLNPIPIWRVAAVISERGRGLVKGERPAQWPPDFGRSPLKKLITGRSPTRFLNRLPLFSGRRNLRKQLRLARCLAASSLPPARLLETGLKPRARRLERSIKEAESKATAESAKRKTGEAELAKERRRAR